MPLETGSGEASVPCCLVEFLLYRGKADLTVLDENKNTALHLACSKVQPGGRGVGCRVGVWHEGRCLVQFGPLHPPFLPLTHGLLSPPNTSPQVCALLLFLRATRNAPS